MFTRTGDDGTTFCVALKTRVSKDHPLIELIGALDEANSFVGLARSLVPPHMKEVASDLEYIQRLMFRVGFMVSGSRSISEDDLRRLEEMADRYYGASPLKSFVLPAGPPPAAALHVARTVVRRAERALVRASRGFRVDPLALRVMNRLSSALFAMAVHVSKAMGYPEEPV
ncbi:MAG: cob(I)yrinic acid a,c-diamide adenosyltransferase [Acidilobus sp.]